MNDNRDYECMICKQQKYEGEGIELLLGFICLHCEAEMIHTDVKDEKYPFFVHQMKQSFVQKNA